MKNKTLILLGFLTLTTQAQAFEKVSGCEEADYIATEEATALIKTQNGYTPKCLRVRVGTTVSIEASRRHPLQGQRDIGYVNNPFRTVDESANTQTHTLTAPGFYGYFCTAHGDESGNGMAGSIQVVE